MSKNALIVDAEVAKAYADCSDEMSFEQAQGIRQLDFRSSVEVTRDEAIKILKKRVPSYNDFRPVFLAHLPEKTRIRIARGGSVEIHATLPQGERPNRSALKCDECSISDTISNTWRLWWD